MISYFDIYLHINAVTDFNFFHMKNKVFCSKTSAPAPLYNVDDTVIELQVPHCISENATKG
jgi:hypothetical protein